MATLDGDKSNAYAERCWSIHANMLERLDAKVIVCMAGDAASFVRSQVGANTLVDTFIEDNYRRLKSYTFTGPS